MAGRQPIQVYLAGENSNLYCHTSPSLFLRIRLIGATK
jgi:hypothetical protein